MRLDLSADTRNAMVSAVAKMIDSGGKAGRIELCTSSGSLLSTLKFAYPCAETPQDGELMFRTISEDPAARQSGLAKVARVVNSDGWLVMECDVTAQVGDGVVRLNSNDIKAGGPVRLTSFRLSAPKS